MTEIKDPILAAMEFSLNYTLMTDEEYKEYIKAKRLYRVIKKEEL